MKPIDILSPANHGKPLWAIFGTYRFEPQITCCKILAYTRDFALLPPGTAGPRLVIWGYSEYRGKPGFRTLGVDAIAWGLRWKIGPFFFTDQADALEKLGDLTKPKVCR